MMTTAGRAFLILVLLVLTLGVGPTKCGDQFDIPTLDDPDGTPEDETVRYGQVAGSVTSGTMVAVWKDWTTGSAYDYVRVQRFNANGVVGSEREVEFSLQYIAFPAVAMNSSDAFVVVWEDYTNHGDILFEVIEGRRYNSDGQSVGSELAVAEAETTEVQLRYPAVALADAGQFMIAWDRYDGDTEQSDIYQRYYSAGGVAGSALQVNTTTGGDQEFPAVAALADGGFLVVWQSGGEIYSRRYAADGSSISPDVVLNSAASSDNTQPRAAGTPDGGWVAVWQSITGPGTDPDTCIVTRRFDALGNPDGTERQVNTDTLGSQEYPWVAVDEDGTYVVVWESTESSESDNDNTSVHGQMYWADGSRLYGQFQVNTLTTGAQLAPSAVLAGSDSTGLLMVVWTDEEEIDIGGGETTIVRGINGQWFAYTAAIFSDGFESGDLSSWSASVP